MSVPSELLDSGNRRDICRFWGDVFGFTELEVMTVDRRRLVLACGHWDQFLYLVADEHPMRAPRMDHFGFSVGSAAELHAARDRAAAFATSDDRVDLIDVAVDDQDVVRIHSIYVGYLLPMLCELQWWEFPS